MLQQEQEYVYGLLSDLNQVDQQLNNFEGILDKYKIQQCRQIIKDIQQDRKALLNVVGNTKIGKSYFCNQLIKVFQQRQDNGFYYLENLFPSHQEEMTSGKVYYQYSNQISMHKIYYNKVSLEDEKEQLINQQLEYRNLSIVNQIKFKEKISQLNFQVLKTIKEDHNIWRNQFQEEAKKKEKSKNKQKMESHLSMSKMILNSIALSKCLKICDHPGLQQQFVAQEQKGNKSQSKIKNSQISINSQRTIIQEPQEEHKKAQDVVNQEEYEYDPRLQFRQGQIIMYCMNSIVNNFKEHIKLLYEQNDPSLIMFAFNFQASIKPGRAKKQSILFFYKSMFHNIPQKFLSILNKIIEGETKKNEKTKLTQEKLQKLKNIQEQLNNYCKKKNKIFFQIMEQQPKREQSMSQTIVRITSRISQKSQIIGKNRYTQEQFMQILQNQKARKQLMEIYPFRLFHMFGLSGSGFEGTPYEPIQELQQMDKILKKKLTFNLKNIIKQIYSKALLKVELQIQQYKNIVQNQKIKKNLPEKKRQKIREIYPKLALVFTKFCEGFQKLEKEVAEFILAQKNLLLDTINRQTNQRNEIILKNSCRFSLLLQKQLKKNIQAVLKNSTSEIICKINQIRKFWQEIAVKISSKNIQIITFLMLTPQQLSSNSFQFQKWSKIVKEKIQKYSNKIVFTIQSNFYSFLYRKIKKLSYNLVLKWNKMLQYIGFVLKKCGLNIKIFNIKLQTCINYNLKIKTFKQIVQVKKKPTAKADFFLSLIITPVNFLLRQIIPNSDNQYYEQEWKNILNGVQQINNDLNALKFSLKIDLIKKSVQEKSLLKQKKEQELVKLQSLQKKLTTIQKQIIIRKETLLSYLNEQ